MFQAGLSWETILKKRENFRLAMDNFDYKKIVNYNEEKINELMNNSGIIRNRRKIESTINNTRVFFTIQKNMVHLPISFGHLQVMKYYTQIVK